MDRWLLVLVVFGCVAIHMLLPPDHSHAQQTFFARRRLSELPLEFRRELLHRFKAIYELQQSPSVEEIGSVPYGQAVPGQSGTGVIVLEKGNELYLDLTPCEMRWDHKQIMSFHDTYAKTAAKDLKCKDREREFKRFKVVQK